VRHQAATSTHHRHPVGTMQKETEIKLRASRETLLALRDHPLLKKRNKSGWSLP